MTAGSPQQAPARKRRNRIRTRNVSKLPTITISTLKPYNIDLRRSCLSLVCPDCETWCPITGAQGAEPKLVPHHTDRAGTANAQQCQSSNRRVELDLHVTEWKRQLAAWRKGQAEANADAASRRATSVRRKPKVPQVPATTQMPRQLKTTRNAEQALRDHRAYCAACAGQLGCRDGLHLARRLRNERQQTQLRDLYARERARFDRRYTRQAKQHNAASWEAQYEATTGGRERMAKRSGTAVEEQNNTCKLQPITH